MNKITIAISLAILFSIVCSSAHATLTDGLIHYWAAEGDFLDSAGTDHGVDVRGVAFTSGRVGQAFSFDGIDDYIKGAANGSSTNGLNAISIGAWVKSDPSSGSGCARIIEIGNSSADSTALVLDHNCGGSFQGTVRAWPDLNGTRTSEVNSDTFANVNYNDDQWHYLVYTYDGSTNRLYIDGTLMHSRAASGTLTNPNHTLIGQHIYSTPDNSHVFGGLIDELTIHNRALSQSEITELVTLGTNGVAIVGNAIPEPGTYVLGLLALSLLVITRKK